MSRPLSESTSLLRRSGFRAGRHAALILAAASPEQIEEAKLRFLGAGFAITWLVIAAYLGWLLRRQKRLEDRFDKIQAQPNSQRAKLSADDKSAGSSREPG